MDGRKALIFDFDGTIADSGIKVFEILNNILPSFGIRKVELSEIEKLRALSVNELFKEFNVPIYKLPLIYFKFEEEYQKIIEELKPIEGISVVLEKLNKKNIPMYIASSNSETSIKLFLKSNNLEYFKNIKGSSGVLGKKRIIDKIVDEEKINKNEVIYVGDEIRDIDSAKKAGVKSAAVTWGFNNKKSLEKENPDFLLTKPEQLLKL